MSIAGKGVYAGLGVNTVINARGVYSTLGGSVLSPRVWAAMSEASRSFAAMGDLLDASGVRIAQLLGARAARVTLGASGAIALGVGACMARGDSSALARLPDTSGMPNEVLVQRNHRYRYDVVARLPGARLVEVGTAQGTTIDQLKAAISSRTAAIFFPAHLDKSSGTVPLTDVTPVAHERKVPVFVDAAYLVYPLELMRRLAKAPVALVCFSAKYFGGPNAGGFVCGQPEWISAVARADFVAFETGEHRVPGRAFKLDRYTVVGVVAALEEWLEMDHAARLRGYARRVRTIQSHLQGLPGITLTPLCFTMEETLEEEPVNCLRVQTAAGTRATPSELHARLAAGTPSIHAHLSENALIVDTELVSDDEADLIGVRLREELS
jgi:L-seryl-tRNA(Ser) seleniumtransferase